MCTLLTTVTVAELGAVEHRVFFLKKKNFLCVCIINVNTSFLVLVSASSEAEGCASNCCFFFEI